MNDSQKFRYYAIDFDDTIAYSEFPLIKKIVPHADRVIRRIKESGGQIAIWTCRTGEHLEQARHFLENNNIPYDYMNEEFQEIAEIFSGSGRKIFADVYIDDKGVDTIANGGVDWIKIEAMIFGHHLFEDNSGDKYAVDSKAMGHITSTPLVTGYIKTDSIEAKVIKVEPLTKG